jgi:hypothetical protein
MDITISSSSSTSPGLPPARPLLSGSGNSILSRPGSVSPAPPTAATSSAVARVVRLCDCPSVQDACAAFVLLAKYGSLLGGGPGCLVGPFRLPQRQRLVPLLFSTQSKLLSFAALNRTGSTQEPHFSPRLNRSKADPSVKAGYATVLVFEGTREGESG